jgi:cysteinyl-tRNA synthetase
VTALRGIVAVRSHEGGNNVSVGNAVDSDSLVSSNPALSSVHSVTGICERSLEQFEAAMCDDLNGPRAAAALFHLVGAAEALPSRGDVSVIDAHAILEVIQKMDDVFGVLYEVPATYVRPTAGSDAAAGAGGFPSPADAPEVRREAEELAVARVRLKLSKQYQEADVLREKIIELGFGVRDVAGGFELFNLPTGA